MEPLANTDDVNGRLLRELSDNELALVSVLLVDASAAVRQAIQGQTLTLVEADVVKLRVTTAAGHDGLTYPIVRLPQRPVIAVHSLIDQFNTAILYTWDGFDVLRLFSQDGWPVINGPYVKLPGTILTANYDHGYPPEEMPDEVVGITCAVVLRALGVPLDETGQPQEAIEGYSHGPISSAAAAGAFGLLQAEKDVLAGLGRSASTVNLR